MRRKLDVGSVRSQNSRIMSSKLTLQIRLYANRFIIIPAEKREEFVTILDELIKRLMKIINSNRTKTTVRLRAMQVLADLIRTSYMHTCGNRKGGNVWGNGAYSVLEWCGRRDSDPGRRLGRPMS